MIKTKTIFFAFALIILLGGILFYLTIIRDLLIISDAKERYLLDTAVYNQHQPKELTAKDYLNPPYMKKYGLNMDDYIDQDGYFSLKGNHWQRWNLETRTVAILMWSDRKDLSSLEIRRIVSCIDKYFETNDSSIALLKVVNVCTKKQ